MALVHFDQEGEFTREAFQQSIKEVFGPRATSYEEGETGALHQRWVDALITYFPPVLPALDVACGPGALSASVSPEGRGSGWTNLDLTPEMVHQARLRAPEATSVIGAVEELDELFPVPAHFESIFCCSAMIYFTDIPAFLRSVLRLLRPGGFLAAHLFTGDSYVITRALETACKQVLGPTRGPRVFRNPNVLTQDPSAVEELLRGSGFTEVENHSVVDSVKRMRLEELAKGWVGGGKQGDAFRFRLVRLGDEEREAVRMRFVEELEAMAGADGYVEERVTCMYVRGRKAPDVTGACVGKWNAGAFQRRAIRWFIPSLKGGLVTVKRGSYFNSGFIRRGIKIHGRVL